MVDYLWYVSVRECNGTLRESGTPDYHFEDDVESEICHYLTRKIYQSQNSLYSTLWFLVNFRLKV